MKAVGPNDVITNHGIEVIILRMTATITTFALPAPLRRLRNALGTQLLIARAHRGHVERLTDWRTTAPDAI